MTSVTTTVTPTTHAIGDLILIFAAHSASTTTPTIAAGYTSIGTKVGGTGATNAISTSVGYKIATATNDASGTWTGAGQMGAFVYRPTSGNVLTIGTSASTNAAITTATMPALTLSNTSGNSWVVGLVGSNTATSITGTSTGMTARADTTTGTGRIAGFDTNAGVATYAAKTVTVAAGNWVGWSVEVVDAAPPPPDGWSPGATGQTGTPTFSNGNKTVSGNGYRVFSATANPTTAKPYFEFTATSTFSVDDNLGLSDSGVTKWVALFTGQMEDSVSGNIGVAQQNATAGDVCGLAFDLVNKLVWYKNFTTGTHNWNNSGTANPSTGTGGIAYTAALVSPVAITYFTDDGSTAGVTLNTGTSAFTGTLPTGFTAWYANPASPLVWFRQRQLLRR